MRIGIDGAFALGVGKNREGAFKAVAPAETKGKEGTDRDYDKEGDRRRFAERIVEMVATDYPGSAILVYTPKVTGKTRLREIDEVHNVEYRVPAPSGFQGRMWRLFGITNCLQPDRIDVYHGLNGELPLNIAASHVATVVSVGEEEMEILRGKGYWPMKQLRQYVAVESLRNATRVIAASEDVKRELTGGYGISCEKIDVVSSDKLSGEAVMAVYERAVSDCREVRPV